MRNRPQDPPARPVVADIRQSQGRTRSSTGTALDRGRVAQAPVLQPGPAQPNHRRTARQAEPAAVPQTARLPCGVVPETRPSRPAAAAGAALSSSPSGRRIASGSTTTWKSTATIIRCPINWCSSRWKSAIRRPLWKCCTAANVWPRMRAVRRSPETPPRPAISRSPISAIASGRRHGCWNGPKRSDRSRGGWSRRC